METIDFNCKRCGHKNTKWVSDQEYDTWLYSQPEILCDTCEKVLAQQSRTAHLETLKTLPIEERIALIEAYIYDKEMEQPVDGGPGPFDLIGG